MALSTATTAMTTQPPDQIPDSHAAHSANGGRSTRNASSQSPHRARRPHPPPRMMSPGCGCPAPTWSSRRFESPPEAFDPAHLRRKPWTMPAIGDPGLRHVSRRRRAGTDDAAAERRCRRRAAGPALVRRRERPVRAALKTVQKVLTGTRTTICIGTASAPQSDGQTVRWPLFSHCRLFNFGCSMDQPGSAGKVCDPKRHGFSAETAESHDVRDGSVSGRG
jgi:hypothetical protein